MQRNRDSLSAGSNKSSKLPCEMCHKNLFGMELCWASQSRICVKWHHQAIWDRKYLCTYAFFEIINQGFEAQRRRYQVLPRFGIWCRELMGGLKLRVFAHACAVSALSLSFHFMPTSFNKQYLIMQLVIRAFLVIVFIIVGMKKWHETTLLFFLSALSFLDFRSTFLTAFGLMFALCSYIPGSPTPNSRIVNPSMFRSTSPFPSLNARQRK